MALGQVHGKAVGCTGYWGPRTGLHRGGDSWVLAYDPIFLLMKLGQIG